MSDERAIRRPWFWGKVVIVAFAAYVGSFVALLGLDARLMTPGQSDLLRLIYTPIIWTIKNVSDTP